jgi:hypothetical protein
LSVELLCAAPTVVTVRTSAKAEVAEEKFGSKLAMNSAAVFLKCVRKEEEVEEEGRGGVEGEIAPLPDGADRS